MGHESSLGIAAPASSDHALPRIKSLWFSPNNGHVLTESDEGEVRMWDVSNGTSQLAPPDIHLPRPPSITTSPDSSYTAQTDSDGELVQVVRMDDKTVAVGPFEPTPRVWQFADDSACVIVGFGNGTIRGISLQTGETIFRLCSAEDDLVDLIGPCSDGSLLYDLAYHRVSHPHRCPFRFRTNSDSFRIL
ncbi:WD40 domain-containing protein [Rhizoctonia solani AG-1 IA]|uniref:WD40 domain-containing protein n=1 Tax=Thanatephorus cucumeris (strain AG1-IA) TaxID=983506 RepID=L8WHJ4_THACA|nr:WD40 domain-containing protein [Rhizoctonia solani AG-1 IA]